MAQTTPLPTGIRLTSLDAEYRENPAGIYDRLRSEDPVHFDEQFQRYFVTRAADIQEVLKDRSMGRDPDKARPDSYVKFFIDEASFEKSMLFLDDPDHARLRSLVTQAFGFRAISELRPHIAEVANRLLDQLEGQDEFDVISEFSSPLPIIIIAEMLGVDPADKDDFIRWSQATDVAFSPMRTEDQNRQLITARDSMSEYFYAAIAERRREPRDDLLSALIEAADGQHRLSDQEIVVSARLLLVAGNVTTTDLIGNAVRLLLEDDEQRRRLEAEPELIDNAVEEVLRLDPPVTAVARITSQPVTVADTAVPAGENLFLATHSAALDPDLNPNPGRFDIARDKPKHIAFGGGAHFCLGAQLARAEAQIAIPLLLARFPGLRLVEAPERKIAPGFNGYKSLKVAVR
ncbi:Cytochrome P450 107B1 [Tsuneonella dongtanensis]|uniref:Cytochrome P450 107B1 n=1 Tax=Tsuneonella dongtanensis TaxID=692370 RepID=A0A1B2ADI0_9SPHN|nr:cytochrome P450 [Tsuneonella dongtanensis]ANY20209.1 Cytochrome P450 107B1 [Tsuneonella dongtanensis]